MRASEIRLSAVNDPRRRQFDRRRVRNAPPAPEGVCEAVIRNQRERRTITVHGTLGNTPSKFTNGVGLDPVTVNRSRLRGRSEMPVDENAVTTRIA